MQRWPWRERVAELPGLQFKGLMFFPGHLQKPEKNGLN